MTLCECGCGEPAPIAEPRKPGRGGSTVPAGQPLRFVRGHHQRLYARNAEHRRRLREKYRISEDDYATLVAEQENRCAICGNCETQTRNGRRKRLALDHDHVTGVVRGLLCQACNVSVGLLAEDPERARALADYVERHAAA